MPTLAWATDQPSSEYVRVKVFQTYDVSTSGVQNAFSYRIVAQDTSSPMPVANDGTTYDTFTLTRDEERWILFPNSSFSASAGRVTHHYLMEPVTPDLSDGLFYVDIFSTSLSKGVNRYYLDIDVMPSSDGSEPMLVPTVHIEGWDGPKVTDPGWRVGRERPDDDNKNSNGNDIKDSDDSGTGGDDISGDGTGNATNKSGTTTSGTSSSGGSTVTTASSSGQSTAKTGDGALEMTLIFAIGCVCLLIGLWCVRRKAGDGRA
jgi:hypothetical protein